MKRQLLPAFLLALLLVAALASTGHAQTVATTVEEIQFPELPTFEIPQPTRVVLDNGMVVMLLEDHELPLVQARAYLRVGSVDDPADHVGLATVASSMMRTGGAGELGPDALDDALEARAASVEAGVGDEAVSVTLSCLAEDFTEVLGLFADVIRRPGFAEDQLEISKTAVASSIARRNDNPLGILFREIDTIIYGEGSPWARQPGWADLANIDRDDLVAWHAGHVHPGDTILGVVGDFEQAEALAAIRRAFGDWKPAAAAGPEMATTSPATAPFEAPEPAIYFVPRDDVTQSFIAFGTLGIRRDHPDYYAVELMNEVLSGGFSSRLFSGIRSRDGLAYSVAGGVGSDYTHPGASRYWMSTKTGTTAAGIEALRKEVRGMITQPPTQEEVEKARAGILNSFIFNSDSRWKILNQQLRYELYGYPLDWLSRYRQGIESVTREQVLEAAKNHLKVDELALLVVGNPEGMDRPLTSFGEVKERDISIPPPPGPGAGAGAGPGAP